MKSYLIDCYQISVNDKEFANNVALAIFVAAFVITFYDFLQEAIRLVITGKVADANFNTLVLPKLIAGTILALLGLGYFKVYQPRKRRSQT